MAKDILRERARALCTAEGVDPDSRTGGGAPAWVARRNELAQAEEASTAAAVAAVAAGVRVSSKPAKPLNARAYGSIGHLPTSRLGPGDWSVTEGMARIATQMPRKGARIVVTEKLDGASWRSRTSTGKSEFYDACYHSSVDHRASKNTKSIF